MVVQAETMSSPQTPLQKSNAWVETKSRIRGWKNAGSCRPMHEDTTKKPRSGGAFPHGCYFGGDE
jgi:hypothetical protein